MQTPLEFQIDPAVLDTDPAEAHRFVYAPTFAPYDPFIGEDVVLLPAHQLDRIALFTVLLRDPGARARFAKHVAGLEPQVAAVERFVADLELPAPIPSPRLDALKKLHQDLAQIGKRIDLAVCDEDAAAIGDAVSELGDVAKSASQAATAAPATSTPAPPAGGAGTAATTPPPPPPGQATVPPDQQLAALVESELGYLFLDRTRIRPLGFALGEHLRTFSLAPGEEVIVEERTYSKKESTFEQSSEREQTFDTEMSSTLTTELNEGMSRERSHTGTDTSSMGVNVGGNIDGITFNVDPTWSGNVQDADRTSANESLKASQVASSKVAARNRSQHKIVLKVSAESRFESTARRTFKNPNATTPIDLVYFKILQRLVLSHERFGVRLCWSPAVCDPAAALFARLERVRREIYDRTNAASAGPRPAPPNPPGAAAQPPRSVSDTRMADKFDPVWGGQSFDYVMMLPAPPGYEWDGGAVDFSFSFTGTRPAGAFVDRVAASPTGVSCFVHVGVEDCRNPFKPAFWEAVGTLAFTATARLVPSPSPAADAAYEAAMAAWREQVAAWEAADRQAKADARAAADELWGAYLKDALAKANAIDETMATMVQALFPSQFRGHIREIDLWQELFDWKYAGLRLYPSWWSWRQPRDPSRSPSDFLNASWARLYLPIKPGAEVAALRWIYERKLSGKASPRTEALISKIVSELKTYRKTSFGSDEEFQVGSTTTEGCPPVSQAFVCLGRWEEAIPTDGTHLEVLLATTTAADDYSRSALTDARSLREEQIARAQRENALRAKAEAEGMGTVATRIAVQLGGDDSG